MANRYSIWLTNQNGDRIKLIDRFTSLRYVLTVNAVGLLTLEVPASFALDDIVQEDSRLEVWRSVPGGQRYLDGETVWLVRDWQQTLSQNGTETITLIAYSANELLDRRIVAYASGESEADKSGNADNIMKIICRENLGSSATDTDRDLSEYLTIAADTSDGPTVAKAFSWRNVLTVLREIAQQADDAGTPTFFGITYDPGTKGLLFKTSTGQWGIDRSQVDNRVVLSPQNGTLAEIQQAYSSSSERNYVYVGGGGQGTGRTIYEGEDAARVGRSIFNRRELFVDARNIADASLDEEAGEALRAYRVRETFAAMIRDSQAIRYGREYRFGDRVVAQYRGRTVAVRVDSIEVSVINGREEIRAGLRADE